MIKSFDSTDNIHYIFLTFLFFRKVLKNKSINLIHLHTPLLICKKKRVDVRSCHWLKLKIGSIDTAVSSTTKPNRRFYSTIDCMSIVAQLCRWMSRARVFQTEMGNVLAYMQTRIHISHTLKTSFGYHINVWVWFIDSMLFLSYIFNTTVHVYLWAWVEYVDLLI